MCSRLLDPSRAELVGTTKRATNQFTWDGSSQGDRFDGSEGRARQECPDALDHDEDSD
jgi:hypothetical protein